MAQTDKNFRICARCKVCQLIGCFRKRRSGIGISTICGACEAIAQVASFAHRLDREKSDKIYNSPFRN